MNREELDAIRERLNKATPGPWKIHQAHRRNGDDEYSIGAGKGKAGVCVFDCSAAAYEGGGSPPSDENADLIVNAPTDIMALIEHIEGLQALLTGAETNFARAEASRRSNAVLLTDAYRRIDECRRDLEYAREETTQLRSGITSATAMALDEIPQPLGGMAYKIPDNIKIIAHCRRIYNALVSEGNRNEELRSEVEAAARQLEGEYEGKGTADMVNKMPKFSALYRLETGYAVLCGLNDLPDEPPDEIGEIYESAFEALVKADPNLDDDGPDSEY